MSRTDDLNYPEGADQSPRHIPHKEGYTIDDYRKIAVIGEGSFGQVWKAERDGFLVALKILNKSLNSKETQDELRSLETLNQLQHRSILQTKNFWSDGERLYIEMELADGGSLKDRLKAYRAAGEYGIPKEVLLKYFLDTAQALDYLHHQTPVMLHRDIKPGNILLVNECAKIADFGLLRQVTGDKSATRTQGGTVLYLAPESISGDVASIHTDLFSFAVTYVELRQGALPFSGKSVGQIYDKIRWERPELSDVLHPEEKKVLLKALEKESHKRFGSCFEFIHQLQRMVPWEPALSLAPVRAPAQATPSLERTPMHHTTPPQPGQGAGATAHRQPIPTHPAVELPPEDGVGPSELTSARGDGTTKEHPVVKGTSKHPPKDHRATVPAPPPPIEVTPSKRDTEPRYTAVPIPKPARRKAPRRFAAAVLLLTLVGVIAGGVWILAASNVKDRVHEHVRKHEFAKALKTIDETGSLLLPDPRELRDEVETVWWPALTPPENADLDSLKRAVRDPNLDEFEKAFPNHDGPAKLRRNLEKQWSRSLAAAKPKGLDAMKDALDEFDEFKKAFPKHQDTEGRRKTIQLGLVSPLSKKLDSQLANNDIDNAVRLLADYRAYLDGPDHDALSREIQNKKNVGKVLADAKSLQATDPEKCLGLLKETKGFDQRDLAERDGIVKAAKNALLARGEKSNTVLILNDASDKAWKALAAEKISIAQRGLPVAAFDATLKASLTKGDFKPTPYLDELSILQTILEAHKAAPEQWDSRPLIDLVRGPGQRPDLVTKVWAALVPFESERNLFKWEQMDDLEGALPSPPARETVRKWNSQILAHFFVRIIEKDQFKWFPNNKKMEKCLVWLGNMEPTTVESIDYIRALKAECEVALGKPIKIGRPFDADWYGKYVEALVLAKDREGQDVARAADILTDGVKAHPEYVRERTSTAVALLRKAVAATIKPKGTDAIKVEDAQKVIAWISLVRELQKELTIDDEINLISAAAKAGRSEVLKEVDARLQDGKKHSAADKQKAYHALAKASRELEELDAEVVAYFVKALDQPSGKDDLRKSIAKDAAGLARELLKKSGDYHKSKDWNKAIEASELCQQLVSKCKGIDLETAADLNAKAVFNQALATIGKEDSKDHAKQLATAYRVYHAAARDDSTNDGFLVPIVLRKFEFASDDRADPLLRQQLKESIPAGEKAVDAARKLAERSTNTPKQKEFWNAILCKGLVALGEAKEDEIEIKIATKELVLTKKEDKKIHREETVKRRTLYEEARKIGAYPETWKLAYLIGDAYYLTCDNPTVIDSEVRQAIVELTAARDALQTLKPPPVDAKSLLKKIAGKLTELQNLQGSK